MIFMSFRGSQTLKDSLETYQREHQELLLLRPVGLRRGLAGGVLNKSPRFSAKLRGGAVFVLYYKEVFVAAMYGN
jgi:hypothetical protein